MNILKYYPLESLNSFKISVFATHYIRINSLKDISNFCSTINIKNIYFYILGGGSNTLFTTTFNGYILHVQLYGIKIIEENNEKVFIKAAAGVLWHKLVLFCIKKDYGGIENLSFIPGTVGGAAIQNIGAYGIEVKDIAYSIEAVELSTGKSIVLKASICGFGYRTSFFKTKWKNKYFITSMTLALYKKKVFHIENEMIKKMLKKMKITKLSFKAISDAVILIRKKKLPDPSILGNAGSFFENPFISIKHYQLLKKKYPSLIFYETQDKKKIKISAAWLIEAVGCKGLRKGDAGVYALHSLILLNYGKASGQDIINLANQIKQKVKNKFNITLVPEVNIVYGSVKFIES